MLAGVGSAASQLNAPRGFMCGYRGPADGDVTTSRRFVVGACDQHSATVCSFVCLARRRLRIEGGPLKALNRVRHRIGGVVIRAWQPRLGALCRGSGTRGSGAAVDRNALQGALDGEVRADVAPPWVMGLPSAAPELVDADPECMATVLQRAWTDDDQRHRASRDADRVVRQRGVHRCVAGRVILGLMMRGPEIRDGPRSQG